jgi:hypothetical protein
MLVSGAAGRYPGFVTKHRFVMKQQQTQARQQMALLARKIALFVGTEENRATAIPRLAMHRRTSPTAPCSMTYEPGITVIAQGRKEVQLGRKTFVYDESRYLLTSVDLPVVSRVVGASEKVPCLAMSLKLDMAAVRELMAREEIRIADAAPQTHAMITGETTLEFVTACCRLVDLLETPKDIPILSGLIEREIIYASSADRRARGCGPSPRWATRATGRRRLFPGSARTTRSPCGWNNWRRSRGWDCLRFIIISAL